MCLHSSCPAVRACGLSPAPASALVLFPPRPSAVARAADLRASACPGSRSQPRPPPPAPRPAGFGPWRVPLPPVSSSVTRRSLGARRFPRICPFSGFPSVADSGCFPPRLCDGLFSSLRRPRSRPPRRRRPKTGRCPRQSALAAVGVPLWGVAVGFLKTYLSNEKLDSGVVIWWFSVW